MYLGLSSGRSGMAKSMVRCISSLGSPTDSPPRAKPSNGRAVRCSADIRLRSSWTPPWTMPNRAAPVFLASRLARAHLAVRFTAASTTAFSAG